MTKLHIPIADRDYGHILKLSDAQYNERLTREMTEKRLAALDRKAQLNDGEPVYIKRGPMSKEHKERISEGLKKYYQQLLNDCQCTNNLSGLSPSTINNPAIYNVLASKYHKADELGIKINLEVFLDLNEIENHMKIYELSLIHI